MGTRHGANDGAARIVRVSSKNGSLAAAARVIVPGSRSGPYGVESVALSPDGAVLYPCARRPATAAGYHYSVVLAAYHAADGRLTRVLGSWNSDQVPCQLAIAPSGNYSLVTGIFTAPAPYATRVNLSTGQAAPVGRAFVPGQSSGERDPYEIAVVAPGPAEQTRMAAAGIGPASARTERPGSRRPTFRSGPGCRARAHSWAARHPAHAPAMQLRAQPACRRAGDVWIADGPCAPPAGRDPGTARSDDLNKEDRCTVLGKVLAEAKQSLATGRRAGAGNTCVG